jgi:hypothetical protein
MAKVDAIKEKRDPTRERFDFRAIARLSTKARNRPMNANSRE